MEEEVLCYLSDYLSISSSMHATTTTTTRLVHMCIRLRRHICILLHICDGICAYSFILLHAPYAYMRRHICILLRRHTCRLVHILVSTHTRDRIGLRPKGLRPKALGRAGECCSMAYMQQVVNYHTMRAVQWVNVSWKAIFCDNTRLIYTPHNSTS